MASSIPVGFDPLYETVENEGALLKVWHQGEGSLLILIQGGGGDGKRFNQSFPLLSQHYKVVTYDRRGNGESTVAEPRILSPMESARDVVAIIKSLGYTKASLFGASSGGIIALTVAECYSELVDSVILHEVPISSILQEETMKRQDAAYQVHQVYQEHGAEVALQMFRTSVTGELLKPPPAVPALHRPPHYLDYFFQYELVVFIIYTPNLLRIRDSSVTIATVEGTGSKGVFHAESARVQSEILKCCHVVWHGAHAPFVEQPDKFAVDLHKTVQLIQTQTD